MLVFVIWALICLLYNRPLKNHINVLPKSTSLLTIKRKQIILFHIVMQFYYIVAIQTNTRNTTNCSFTLEVTFDVDIFLQPLCDPLFNCVIRHTVWKILLSSTSLIYYPFFRYSLQNSGCFV